MLRGGSKIYRLKEESMNRFVFHVVAIFESDVVGTDTDDVTTKVRAHLRRHPERLTIDVKGQKPCELLEEWEVKS